MRDGVVEHDAGVGTVADVVPEPAVAVRTTLLVTHRHSSVVGVQHLGSQHMVLQQFPQRLQLLGASRHPVAHGRTRQRRPQPLETLFGAMERQVILIFVGDDLGQQPRAGQALVNRLRRLGGQDDVLLAAFAGVLDLLVRNDEHLGRFVVVLLGGLDADRRALLAALWTEPFRVRQFVTFFFTAQMSRRSLTAMRLALAAPSGFVFAEQRGRWRRGRGRRRHIVFGKQQQLIGIDRSWPRPIETFQQGV